MTIYRTLKRALLFATVAVLPVTGSADETCNSPYISNLIKGQEDFVYVWTLGEPGLGDGSDKLVTVDVNPKSNSYGKVIHTVSTGGRGEAHHMGYTDDRRFLWAGGLDDSKIHVFDVHSDPAKPRLVRTIADLAGKSGFIGPHTFYALPGRMLVGALSNTKDHGGVTGMALIFLYYFDLYDMQRLRSRGEVYFRLLMVVGALSLVLAALSCFFAAWSLCYGSEYWEQWQTMRLFLGVVSFVALVAAPLYLVAQHTRRLVLSALFLLHFGGICTASLAAPPTPWIGSAMKAAMRPLVEVCSSSSRSRAQRSSQLG